MNWYIWLFLSTITSLSLVVLSYPAFTFGLWPQSEPIIIGLFVSAIISVLGLIGLFTQKPQRVRQTLMLPLVCFPFIIALASAAFSLVNTFPQRTWFGAPELGEGVLWFAALGLLTANASILKNIPLYRKALGLYAGIMGLVITLLTIKGDSLGAWRPFFFSDYIAFLGIFLFPILVVYLKLHAFRHKVVAFIVACLPLYFSSNRAAQPLVILAPLLGGIAICFFHYFKHARLLSATSLVLMPFGLVSFIMFISHYFSAHSEYAYLTQSIWSRHNLFLSAFEALKASSLSQILMGQGWGSFTDISIAYIPFEQTKLFMQGTTGSEKAFWDALARADFHSHSEVIESIVSIGILGMLLVVLYPAICILTTPKKYLPLAFVFIFGYVLVSTFWFQMPLTLPFFALALGGIAGPQKKFRIPLSPGAIQIPIALFTCLLALSWGTWKNTVIAHATTDFIVPSQNGGCTLDARYDLGDNALGGKRLAMIYHSKTEEYLKAKTFPEAEYEWLRCAIDYYHKQGSSLQLQIVDLLSRSTWAYGGDTKLNTPVIRRLMDSWGNDLEKFLSMHKNRSDLAVPYLSWQITHGNEALALPLIQKMYQHEPFDPVALWFLGMSQLNDPNTLSRGIYNMRFALTKGIQNIIPIEKQLIQQIENANI